MITVRKLRAQDAVLSSRKAGVGNVRWGKGGLRLSDLDLQEAWEAYKRTGDPEAKERLILEYAPLVRQVAARVAIGLPSNIDHDDLLSYGFFGLLDAINRFEPERQIKFETYAARRVRGSMIDGIRASDWVPRSVRQKAKAIEQAIAHLEMEKGRPPTDAEVAEYLNISLTTYHQYLHEVSVVSLASLDDVWSQEGEDEGNLRLGQMVEDQTCVDPEEQVTRNEMKRLLAEAIDQLPERERLVITLYYYEELTLKEIGEVLSVSESRISQIHTKSMMQLRNALLRHKESLVS